jgi:hypothetical protein
VTRQETARLVALAMANWPGMQDRNVKIEATALLWQRMLNDVPYELAEKALCKVLMTAKFWPTVSEIREAVDSLRPPVKMLPPTDEAWEEVCRNLNPYRAPQWSHEAIARAVRSLGGIRTICDAENLAVIRAHFFKMYETVSAREKEKSLNEKVITLIERTEIKCLG